MDPIAQNRATMLAECGRVVLWTGIETRGWNESDWRAVAAFCQAHSIDSVCIKVSDGGVIWMPPAEAANLRHIFNSEYGRGLIPFVYCYGPKFGIQQVTDEANVIASYWHAGLPVVQADMEAEYNGQTGAAEQFAHDLAGVPGLLSISTWGDPTQQNWQGVARALAPVANAWTPQEYTNFLSGTANSEYDPAVYTCIQPGIDLTQEFGANNQKAIVGAALSRGAETFYLWEYEPARNNPGLVDELVSLIHSQVPAPGPTPSPSPGPGPNPSPTPPPPAPDPQPQTYRVRAGDTLSGLALRFYHNAADWPTIYDANRGLIRNPDMIQIGWVLTIPAQPE